MPESSSIPLRGLLLLPVVLVVLALPALGHVKRAVAVPDTWSPATNMATARSGHTATRLLNGRVLLAGGQNQSGQLVTAEIYDPLTNGWAPAGSMASARAAHTATLLPSGKVLVVGGFGVGFADLASAEVYDPVGNTWSPAGSMAGARSQHSATLLPNGGTVLVAGGITAGVILASSELYDPVANGWVATDSMATKRYIHTATALPNGQVLVAGGYGNNGWSAGSEVYDPAADTWTVASGLAMARYGHTASLLTGGKVLVSGGFGNGGPLASAEIYDPTANTWSVTGSMATARFIHTATLLPSGKVLVVAGGSGNAPRLASAELYDPTAGIWTTTGSTAVARQSHTATLLANGKVLATGGYGNDFPNFLASAELYEPQSHRKVVFIQGIASGTESDGVHICEGVKNRTRWMQEYFKGSQFAALNGGVVLDDSNFVYFDYAPGFNDAEHSKSCRTGIGEECANCGAYRNQDTCISIDGPGGSAELFDRLIRDIIQDDPEAEIHVLAHSMGGLVTGYWLATDGADPSNIPGDTLPEIRDHVESIVLFDSAPNGFPWTTFAHELPNVLDFLTDSLSFSADCAEYGDAPEDLRDQDAESVVKAVRDLTDQPGMAKVFALDSYPGQAGAGFGLFDGPCDAVAVTERDGRLSMGIGTLPIRGKTIWARTHGVIWDDGWKSGGGVGDREAALGLLGTSVRAVGWIGGWSFNILPVSSTTGLSVGDDVMAHCVDLGQIAEVNADDNEIVVPPHPNVVSASNTIGWVTKTLEVDTADNRGLGYAERRSVRDVIGCAVAQLPTCGSSSGLYISAGGSGSVTTSVATGTSSLMVSGTRPPVTSGSALVAAAGTSSLQLTSPGTQTVVTGSNAATLGVGYVSTETYETFTIPNPEAGEWLIEVDGTGLTLDADIVLTITTTLPAEIDADGDGLPDVSDNCASVSNQDQIDIDSDGVGDICDTDADGDTFANDTDNCSSVPNLGQEWSDRNFIDQTPPSTQDDRTWPNSDAAGDACDTDDDNDGILDADEAAGCNASGALSPTNLRDTDGDRVLDGAECVLGTNPTIGGANKPTAAQCAAHPGGGGIGGYGWGPVVRPDRVLRVQHGPAAAGYGRGSGCFSAECESGGESDQGWVRGGFAEQ